MLVIDTSVAVKWVVPENGGNIETETDIALDLLSRGLIAPDCMAAEFANALFKKVQRGEIVDRQAKEAVDILPDLVNFLPTPALIAPALDLALSIGHPIHDCIFLVTAMQHGYPLITADRKFVEKCRRSEVEYPIFVLSDQDWQ